MSSPSTPNNSHNHHKINHFPQKNSWHSSYAPNPYNRSRDKKRRAASRPPHGDGSCGPSHLKTRIEEPMDSHAVKHRHLPSHQDQRPSLPVARHHRLRLLLLPPQPPPRPRCRLHSQSRAPAPRNRAISTGERPESGPARTRSHPQLPAARRRRIHPTRHLPALCRHRRRPDRSRTGPQPPLRPPGRQLQRPRTRSRTRVRRRPRHPGQPSRPHTRRPNPRRARRRKRRPLPI